jgi:predicted CXXCH cytochrome family protein
MCIRIGLAVLVALLISTVSCDDVQRHGFLTFFFDGVPPPAGAGDPNAPGGSGTRGAAVRYEHPSGMECGNCHTGGQRRRGLEILSMAQVDLIAPVPVLCYNCHTDYNAESAFVHGPAAVGQCLFCHDPHRAANKYLLKEPVPQLCYLCHDKQMIESIAEHAPDVLSDCSACHEGHSAQTKGLLKEDWKETTK